jgi:hypothetical protein
MKLAGSTRACSRQSNTTVLAAGVGDGAALPGRAGEDGAGEDGAGEDGAAVLG